MTFKTIPAYLENERQKLEDDKMRIQAEAERIQPLHHGHHRAAKQPKLELPAPVKAKAKAKATKTTAAARKKPPTRRKTASKVRKIA